MTKQFDASRMSKKTSWDKVAQWYDQLVGDGGSEYHREVIFPHLLKILNIQKGDHVLDLACGQGVFCRILEKLEAIPTGVDISEKLIRSARERSKSSIRYEIRPAHALAGFADESFDVVISILAIQNIDPLEKVLQEVTRVTKKKGQLFLVLNHPCFRIPRQSHWGFDEKNKTQYRRLDQYLTPLKIPIQMHPGDNPELITWSFHRPLSFYVQILRESGWAVTHLEEWVSHKKSEPGPKAKAEDKARDEIPLFLALGAVKTK